jgi:hypothetical protein
VPLSSSRLRQPNVSSARQRAEPDDLMACKGAANAAAGRGEQQQKHSEVRHRTNSLGNLELSG